tara:strand:+ start:817 stop:996 length:180 start_codon:yes stop_codon:yes gene_type:complete
MEIVKAGSKKYNSPAQCLKEWNWEHGGINEFANLCSSYPGWDSYCTKIWFAYYKEIGEV